MREELEIANSELAKLKNKSDIKSFPDNIKAKFLPTANDYNSNFVSDHKMWIASIFIGILLAFLGFYFPEAFSIFKGDGPGAGDGGQGAGGDATSPTTTQAQIPAAKYTGGT